MGVVRRTKNKGRKMSAVQKPVARAQLDVIGTSQPHHPTMVFEAGGFKLEAK
jgi:hypothetical protein